MAFKLRCPDCRDTFPWDAAKSFPRFCPLCRSDMGEERADDDVVMPFIRTSGKTARTDQVYRDIERSSEVRAEVAAEAAGCSVADMSGLKVTDLNDRRDAEVSVKFDAAAYARLGVKSPHDLFKGGGEEYSKGTATGDVTINGKVTQGIAPRAGSNTLARIQRMNGRG